MVVLKLVFDVSRYSEAGSPLPEGLADQLLEEIRQLCGLQSILTSDRACSIANLAREGGLGLSLRATLSEEQFGALRGAFHSGALVSTGLLSIQDDLRPLEWLLYLPEEGSKRAGLVLNALEWWREKGGDTSDALPAFRLVTGACQFEFVTLWELYDHAQEFRKTAQDLADLIRELRRTKRFQFVATGGPVGREILNFIHAEIEKPDPSIESSTGEDVGKVHLGPHSSRLFGRTLKSLDQASVLLLTDVLGRRGSIQEISRLVANFGGQCTAAVSPLMISPDLILSELIMGTAPMLPVDVDHGSPIGVSSLATFPVKELAGSLDHAGLFILSDFIEFSSGFHSLADFEDSNALGVIVNRARTQIGEMLNGLPSPAGDQEGAVRSGLIESLRKSFERPFLGLDQSLAGRSIHAKTESAKPAEISFAELEKAREGERDIFVACFCELMRRLLDRLTAFVEKEVGSYFSHHSDPREAALLLVNSVVSTFARPGYDLTALCSLREAIWTSSGTTVKPRHFVLPLLELFSSFQDREFNRSQFIAIDPLTNLPALPIASRSREACFSREELFDMLRSHDCVEFGFFQGDTNLHMISFRLREMLAEFGDTIWERVFTKPLASTNGLDERSLAEGFQNPSGYALVTTVESADLFLANSLKEWARGQPGFRTDELKYVLIPRKDTIGASDHSYFPQPVQKEVLDQRHAILVISSAYSADKLRHLTALLTRENVHAITVICFFNRMGAQSAEFVARLSKLSSERGSEVPFNFIPAFNVPELRSEDVERIQQEAFGVFSNYASATRIPMFQRLSAQYDKYFEPRYESSRRFQQGRSRPFVETIDGDLSDPTDATLTVDCKMLSLYNSLVTQADYDTLIEQGLRIKEKNILLPIFGILMGDIRFLRVTGKAELVYQTARTRLKTERKLRLGLNERLADQPVLWRKEIEGRIDTELHLMLGVVVLAAHDRAGGDRWIWQILFWTDDPTRRQSNREASQFDREWTAEDLEHRLPDLKVPPDEWTAQDLLREANIILYLADERMAWITSMMLRSGMHSFATSSVHARTRKNLLVAIHTLIRFTQGVEERMDGKLTSPLINRTDCSRVRTNLQALRNDAQGAQQNRRVDVIRLLHRKLVLDRSDYRTSSLSGGHNPIFRGLNQLTSKLGELLFDRQDAIQGAEVLHSIEFWAGYDSNAIRHLLELLTDGVKTAAALEQVALACLRLFEFAPKPAVEAGAFALEGDRSEFSKTVGRLAQMLEVARREKRVSRETLEQINTNAANIRNHMIWDRDRPVLMEVLSWYVVPLNRIIRESREEADIFLAAYGQVWTAPNQDVGHPERADADTVPVNRQYVLIDRSFLKEVLKNIFNNARHSLEKLQEELGSEILDFSRFVKWKVRPATDGEFADEIFKSDPDGGPSEYLVLEIGTYGRLKRSTESSAWPGTIERHRSDLAAYGGLLLEREERDENSATSKLGWTVFSVVLVSRNAVREALDREGNQQLGLREEG